MPTEETPNGEQVLSLEAAAALNVGNGTEIVKPQDEPAAPAEEEAADEVETEDEVTEEEGEQDEPLTRDQFRNELLGAFKELLNGQSAGQAPAAKPEPQPLSEEEQAIENQKWFDRLYSDPRKTLREEVLALIGPILQPLQTFVQTDQTQRQLNAVVEQVKAANPDFVELTPDIQRVITENPWLASNGKQGLEAAVIMARAKQQRSATNSATRRAAGLGAAAKPAGKAPMSQEEAIKQAILLEGADRPRF